MVVDARVEAGGSLVAPDGGLFVRQDVGERAVEQLEQFIPLSGVVETSVVAAESDSVVNDVLWGEECSRMSREREK